MPTREQLMNIDPRQLAKFQKMPEFQAAMTSEESKAVQYRMATAKWTREDRIVYDAIADGFKDMDSLPVATGLSEERITKSIENLSNRGYLKRDPSQGVLAVPLVA